MIVKSAQQNIDAGSIQFGLNSIKSQFNSTPPNDDYDKYLEEYKLIAITDKIRAKEILAILKNKLKNRKLYYHIKYMIWLNKPAAVFSYYSAAMHEQWARDNKVIEQILNVFVTE